MSVDSKGLIKWQPTAAQIGRYSIGIKVSDTPSQPTQTYQLDVTNQIVNHTPTITSVPTFVTNLERSYSYNLTATDSDGDALAWSLDAAPAGMVIDAATGALRWQPTVGQIGTHTIKVRVTDSIGAYSAQEYTLKVNGIDTPPQIQSSPNTQAGIDSAYQYQVVATDTEGDALSYQLGRAPNGMKIDPTNGLVAWTPTAANIGTQAIDILVTDAQGAVTTQTYNLVVGNAPINQPPAITSNPPVGANIGSKYTYQVVATDPENGQLNYQLINPPSGMTINPTGLIDWDRPTLGNYPVVIKVTDNAGNSVAQGYTLTAKVNHAPTISSTPQDKVTLGNTYRYDVVAKDIDNDALTYSIDSIARAAGVSIDT